LRDEIGHVAIANRWYVWLCEQREAEPISTYSMLAATHGAPTLRGPFNIEARRKAGLREDELLPLERSHQSAQDISLIED
jgi:uncharacterized ferritin-like protein (DUF455 family)